MNEEIILTKNIAHVHIYKGQDVLLYSRDKVFEVLDNNDTISIILSNFKFFHVLCPTEEFLKK